MNGKSGTRDINEWHFVYRDPNERDDKDNHLLKFAEELKFKYAVNFKYPGKDLDKLIEAKEKIRKDTIYDPSKNLPKYNLKKRQDMVGGCWNNYNEEEFKQWFQWRNAE